MKAMLPVALVFTAFAFADEADDRASIESVIHALNDPSAAAETLFADGSTGELARLTDLDRLFPDHTEPMSEVSVPGIVSGSTCPLLYKHEEQRHAADDR